MNLGRFVFFACVAGGLVARAPLASADPLFDNISGVPSGEAALAGDTVGQSFSYTAGYTITGLDLVMDSHTGSTGSFTVLVVATTAGNLPDLASTPAITVGTFSDSILAPSDSAPAPAHFKVSNVVLGPSDAQYWVVVEDAALSSPLSPATGADWWYQLSPTGTGTTGQLGYDASNSPTGSNPFTTDDNGPFLMTVDGFAAASVVEPETLAVLSMGLAGLGIARLRRRRSSV